MTEHIYNERVKFFAVSGDLLCITDHEGHFVSLNQQWEITMGYNLAHLQDRKLLDLVHPEDLDETVEYMRSLARGDKAENFVNRCRCKDGSYRYLEWRALLDGKLVYSVARDISATIEEKKALGRMVEISEEFLQTYGEYLDYQQITDDLLAMSGAKYAVFNLYDEDGRQFTTVALSGGHSRSVARATELLGYDIEGKKWPHDPVRAKKIRGGRVNRFSSLHQLSGDILSPALCCMIHKLFSIGEVVLLKIAIEDTMIGDFTIFMGKGKQFVPNPLVEVYLRQLGMLITRARAEEKLRKSEESLREAQRIARFGHWEHCHSTKTLKWTDTVYEIFEVSTSDGDLYLAHLEPIHPDDREEISRVWCEALDKKHPYEVTHRLLMPDGRVKWVHEAGKTSFDIIGRPVRTVGVIQDVTEQKQAEEKLRQSEEMYRRIVDNVSDVVWTTDMQLKITYVSPSVERLTGYPLNKYLDMLSKDKYTPQSLENMRRVFAAEFERENDPSADKDRTMLIEAEHHHADGGTIWIAMHVSLLRDEEGNLLGLQGVSRDITEQRRQQARVEFLSYHDQLTGLYNRTRFEIELKRLEAVDYLPLGLAIIDVNGLKLANDAFGHLTGDEVLKRVAKVIQKVCHHKDVVARIGGDEFVVLLPNTDSEAARGVTKSIVDLVAQERVGAISLSVSCGLQIRDVTSESIDSLFRRAEDDLYRHKLSESSSMRHTTVSIIMNTLYEKSPREQQHSHRVSQLCADVGIALGLSQHDVSELRTAGLMHDIGKIAIEDGILNKSKPLSDEEWLVIKRHPEIGYRILSSVNTYAPLAEYVLAHQERWDGKGYPKGLGGGQIPYAARIIAVADAYDAMTTDRSYRKAMSKEAALAEIARHAGTQFDPHIASVFVQTV